MSFKPGCVRSEASIEKQRATLRRQYANRERDPPRMVWTPAHRERFRRMAESGAFDARPVGFRRQQRCRGKVYWVIKAGPGRKGWVYEHRHVLEQKIGRKLVSGELVHHKSGNTLDNDPDNLELMTRSQHTKHHQPEMRRAQMFKSIAQRRKMTEKLAAGEITQAAFDLMADGTPESLPERLHPKKYEFTPREKELLLQALHRLAHEQRTHAGDEFDQLIAKLEAE